jgi:putative chitinase
MALKIDLAMLNKGLGLKTAAQRSGVKALVDAFASDGDDDKRKLAYILATARHETGGKYQPVREIPPKRKLAAYWRDDPPGSGLVYYGRGLPQLTWRRNYATFGKLLGVDLVGQPDLALVLATSARITVIGMMRGLFTGKKLGDYFTKTTTDWENARRTVNGMDKAGLIASYAKQALDAITASLPATKTYVAALPPEPPADPLTKSRINQLAVGGAAATGVSAVSNIATQINTVSDQVTTVTSNAQGALETTTATVRVIKENHGAWSGWLGWIFSPWTGAVVGSLAVVVILAILYYRWRLKERFSV